VALGLGNAADLYKRGLLTKEGSREAMDHYFHQVARGEVAAANPGATDADVARSSASKRSTK
jgi:hypothetical protein